MNKYTAICAIWGAVAVIGVATGPSLMVVIVAVFALVASLALS